VSEEEKEFFGKDFNSFTKHFMIHKILNTEYEILFFENCVSLKYFDNNLTFYKDFIEKNINNP
jgi:hypothetical protein